MANTPVQTAVPSPGNTPERFSLVIKNMKMWYTALSPLHKNILLGIGIGLFAIAFIGLNMFAFQYGQRLIQKKINTTTLLPTPTPTPTPIPFKHKGKMEFSVSTSGSVPGPKITACSIDPLDFTTAKIQTFQMTITSATPVASASIGWKTDSKEQEVPLILISGTKTKGVWEGKKQVSDTAWYRYELVMRANDGTHTRETVLTLR